MPYRQLFILAAAAVVATIAAHLISGQALAVFVFFVAALAIAMKNFIRLGNLVALGEPEPLLDQSSARGSAVVEYIFGQRKLFEDFHAGWMHLCFLYGLFVLSVGHFELVARVITKPWIEGGLGFHLLSGMQNFKIDFYHIFLVSQDVAAAICIVVSVIALVRRWTYHPERLRPRSQDAENILWFIIALYITFFVLNGAEVALGGASGWFRPFSAVTAKLLFSEASSGSLRIWLQIGLWSHLIIFLSFLNYLAYSKHLHLIAAFPNIFLRRFVPRGRPSTLDFENSERFGIDKVEQYSFKTLLDGFACTECARCDAVCPAHLTGKPLKPKKVLHDIKLNLYRNEQVLLPWKAEVRRAQAENRDLPEPLEERSLELISKEEIKEEHVGFQGRYAIHGQIHVDEIWACTTCAACIEACPVLIESVPVSIIELRRHLVMMEADFPQELTPAFNGMEVQCNPWGIGKDKREDWCRGLDVPKMRDVGDREVDYLFWVGCAGASDDRAKKTQQAFVKILQAAKVDFAILGEEEKCTGDPARRMGNEYLYASMVEDNRGVLEKYRFKKIVTTCPHCLNAYKNDYPQFDIQYEVVHHTDLIQELIAQKRIQLHKTKDTEPVTFHDPCYLGRYNDVYDSPRQVLKSIEGLDLREMEFSKKKSFCCGAGGGRMWQEELIGDRVNTTRTKQAVDTGAKTVCVACPFCTTMIEDGTKALDLENSVKVLDLAEIVAEHLVPSGS